MSWCGLAKKPFAQSPKPPQNMLGRRANVAMVALMDEVVGNVTVSEPFCLNALTPSFGHRLEPIATLSRSEGTYAMRD
jgi:hypothetical protein